MRKKFRKKIQKHYCRCGALGPRYRKNLVKRGCPKLPCTVISAYFFRTLRVYIVCMCVCITLPIRLCTLDSNKIFWTGSREASWKVDLDSC